MPFIPVDQLIPIIDDGNPCLHVCFKDICSAILSDTGFVKHLVMHEGQGVMLILQDGKIKLMCSNGDVFNVPLTAEFIQEHTY